MFTKVEDLKCGDVINFRGRMLVCLLNFTDNRHTQTVVTCVSADKFPMVTEVVALRLLRTFRVELIKRINLGLSLEENTSKEVTDAARVESPKID